MDGVCQQLAGHRTAPEAGGGQANALLVAKLDRLTRSVKDLGALVEDYFSSDTITLLSVADH